VAVQNLAALRNPYALPHESKWKFYAARPRRPAGKEVFMLDVAFVVLGLAVLALMGVYAIGLRQL
jgi:hypothetical protein